jgi:DNA-directed RNA polymerase subunit RPC12/RpoP
MSLGVCPKCGHRILGNGRYLLEPLHTKELRCTRCSSLLEQRTRLLPSVIGIALLLLFVGYEVRQGPQPSVEVPFLLGIAVILAVFMLIKAALSTSSPLGGSGPTRRRRPVAGGGSGSRSPWTKGWTQR